MLYRKINPLLALPLIGLLRGRVVLLLAVQHGGALRRHARARRRGRHTQPEDQRADGLRRPPRRRGRRSRRDRRPLRAPLHERPVAARRVDGQGLSRPPGGRVGLGSQPVASQARSEQGSPTRFVSHTTPLTVAAELGVIGWAAYFALIVGAGDVLIDRVRRRAPRARPRARCGPPRALRPPACLQRLLRGSGDLAHDRSGGELPALARRRRGHTRGREPRRPLGAAGDARRARRDHDARPRLWRLAVRSSLGRPAWRPRPAPSASPTASGTWGSSARRRSSPGSSSRSLQRPGAGASAPGRALGRDRARRPRVRDALPAGGAVQVGPRDATAPWYFTNDSTYQIEIAGDPILDGDSPYGHDYGDSGLENFYPAADDEEAGCSTGPPRHHCIPSGHGSDRGCVADPAAAVGRLPALRPARDLRSCCRRPCFFPGPW